jgi:hypothetical protein
VNLFAYLVQSAVPVLWPLIAVVGALVHPSPRVAPDLGGDLAAVMAIGALACGSLWMAVSFLAIPNIMATAVGFGRTPFEFEIAFGLATLGFRARSATPRERITIGLSAGMFLWGAVIGHLYQWFANSDHGMAIPEGSSSTT